MECIQIVKQFIFTGCSSIPIEICCKMFYYAIKLNTEPIKIAEAAEMLFCRIEFSSVSCESGLGILHLSMVWLLILRIENIH